MKKLATLLLLSTIALAGCTSIQRGLRGDDYVDSSISAAESSKAAAQAAKDLNDALTNENANFPQLSKSFKNFIVCQVFFLTPVRNLL